MLTTPTQLRTLATVGQAMRVLLTLFGSRGDAHPMLALGSALQKAGHHPVVTGPPDFVPDALRVGVPYVAHGPGAQAVLKEHQADMGANPIRMVRVVRKTAADQIDGQFKAVTRLARDTDMIVSAGLMWAGSSVAEAYGLPYRYVAYTPDIIPSRYYPPPLSPWQNLPHVINRIAWAGFDKLVNWLVLGSINRNRGQLGLCALPRIAPHAFPRENTILAADPELATWSPDTGISSKTLGALQLADARELEPQIERFLAAGETPVYIGFGSMVDPIAAKTTRALVEVITALGCRAIIGAGWAGLGLPDAGSQILFVGPTCHQKLFARVSVVVHHGGAGTTHTAARAGVPQLIVPHLLDQFGWAKRVHLLGLSPKPIPRTRLNARSLAEGLRECLTSIEIRERASAMRRSIGERTAVHDPLAGLELGHLLPRPGAPERTVSSGSTLTAKASA
jgi:vancomycin aglycone glucosyltransferase